MRGSFIVFEGPDGSGTTRHSEFLTERLRSAGFDVVLTAEPTDGIVGKKIRSILNGDSLPPADAVQLLFCADRAEHIAKTIIPAIKEGKVVICDRYTLSTLIYGEALGLDVGWLKQVNEKFPPPDFTIITLPPFETCMNRMGRRDSLDQFENEELQQKVYDGYAAVKNPATIFVDTSGEKEEVADHVWSEVQKYFGPISREVIAEL